MKKIQVILLGAGLAGAISQGTTGLMQMGFGLANAIKAKKAKKEMDANTPLESDPRQVAIVDSLRRKRLSQQSGASTAISQGNRLVNELISGARNKAVGLSGGNTGTLLATLSTSQAAADNQVNDLQAQAEKDAAGTMVLENAAQNDVVQRKMDVQMLKFNTANATYNAEKKAAQSNLAAGAANVIGGGASMFGAKGKGYNKGVSASGGEVFNGAGTSGAGGLNTRKNKNFIAPQE